MKIFLILFFLIAVHGSRDIGNEEYDTLVEGEEYLLVLFYAPWCHHCQILKPEFDKASITLQDKATLAKVDCTQNAMLCDRLDINSYPTLKFYLRGEQFEYSGGRSQKEIENWILNVILPKMHKVTQNDSLQEILINHPLVLVCYLQCSQVSNDIMKRFSNEVVFIDASLIPNKYQTSNFLFYAAHLQQPVKYSDFNTLGDFIENYKNPFVKEFTQIEEQMVVLFYSFDEMNEQFTKIYNKFQIAAQVYPNINFVKADIDTDLARMMQVLQTPQIQYITYIDKQFQHCALNKNLEKLESIVQFIENPPLKPYRRAIPKMITDLNQIDRKTDTLILFFTYRSKKSQKLLQLITQLYQEYEGNQIKFAKVDVDEHPNVIQANHFPQIYLFLANKEPVIYDMETKIDKAELEEWIKKQQY